MNKKELLCLILERLKLKNRLCKNSRILIDSVLSIHQFYIKNGFFQTVTLKHNGDLL